MKVISIVVITTVINMVLSSIVHSEMFIEEDPQQSNQPYAKTRSISSANGVNLNLQLHNPTRGGIYLRETSRKSQSVNMEEAAKVTYNNYLLLKQSGLTSESWSLPGINTRGVRGGVILADLSGGKITKRRKKSKKPITLAQLNPPTDPLNLMADSHVEPPPVQIVQVQKSPDIPSGYKNLVVRFNFPSASWALSDKDKQELEDYAAALNVYMAKDNAFGLLLEGHTDSDKFRPGSVLNNQYLSELRAASVTQEIAKNIRIYSKRMKAAGYADKEIIFNNDGVEDKYASRRLEIKPLIVSE